MVFSAARAEQGSSQAELGPLQRPAGRAGPGAGGAIEVAVTADARLAFVSLEGIAQIAAFSLQHALTRGFGPADYIGSIPAGLAPVGLAVPRTAAGCMRPARSPAAGRRAPAARAASPLSACGGRPPTPAHAVVSTATAGCEPVRVITSADGRAVWVTARGSNALLGFAAGGCAPARPARCWPGSRWARPR